MEGDRKTDTLLADFFLVLSSRPSVSERREVFELDFGFLRATRSGLAPAAWLSGTGERSSGGETSGQSAVSEFGEMMDSAGLSPASSVSRFSLKGLPASGGAPSRQCAWANGLPASGGSPSRQCA